MAVCLILGLIPSSLIHAADPNVLYVVKPTSQMTIGTIFTVNVWSYAATDLPNGQKGTAKGSLTYPTDKLQVVNAISTADSAYSFTPSPNYYITQESGKVGFSGLRNSGESGQSKLFAVTFKATAAGSAVVGFTVDSKVNNTVTSYNNGTYTITNPNPPASTPSSTPKPSTTPKVSTTPVPVISAPDPEPSPVTTTDDTTIKTTPDPTGLIDSVNVTPLFNSATIVWRVNATNSSATLSYGTSTAKLDKRAAVSKKSDGMFSAQITGLSPGIRYIFTISASGDNSQSGNYTGSIPTRGYPVTITITENNQPIESGQLKIGTQSWFVGSSGKITVGLAAGSYSGQITTDTSSLAINLTVEAKAIPTDNTSPESQAFSYNLTSSPLEQGPGSSSSILTFVGVLGGGIVLVGLGFVGFLAYRRRRFESGGDDAGYHMNNTPSVIIDDGYQWQEKTPQNNVVDSPSALPSSAPLQPPAAYAPHHNSVYLSEEEPLDMFEEAARSHPSLPSAEPTSPNPDATGQNPNSPHSTTL